MKTLRVACLYFSSDSRSEMLRVAEACLRWTPQIAVSDVAIFLEVGRCQGIYREEWLALRLKAMAQKFNCKFQIAFSEDAPRALALARLSREGMSEVPAGHLPVEALMDYANPFGMDPETFKLVREMTATLKKLGIQTVSSFLALSAKSIPSRFGKLGLLLHQRVREAALIPWPRFMPPDRVLERAQFEIAQPFEDLEPLVFFLKPVIDRAMARLKGRGERATAIRLKLKLERYSILMQEETQRNWRLDLALPQGSSVGLIPLIRERLSADLAQKPLAAPVIELEFEVMETAPGVGAQRDFFDAHEEEVEAWNSLIGRLAEKLGDGKVFFAQPVERYLPEKAWIKAGVGVPPLCSTQTPAHGQDLGSYPRKEGERGAVRDVLPDRPLRLLEAPLPLQKNEGRLELLEGSQAWKVTGVEGPEILSGEWWFRQFQRSYFKLATDSGEKLWVFQTPQSGTLYLHGYFD